MGWVVKFEAQQTVLDPTTGEVLVEAGELSDDPSVLDEGGSVYKPVAVQVEDKPKKDTAPPKEDKDEKDDKPKPHPAAHPAASKDH